MVLQAAPFMPNVLKQVRGFLGEAARLLSAQGYDRFIDFASGLPTVDHIHLSVPEGAKVIYSDSDQLTVDYGREILDGNNSVRYELCDAINPGELLDSKVVRELMGEDHKVVFGFSGIAYFLEDQQIAHALRGMYDWAAPGSKVFLCDGDGGESNETEKMKIIKQLYEQIGQPLHTRTKEKLLELARPWQVDKPGVKTLDEWLNAGEEVIRQQKEEWGGGGFYGVILYK